jgi:cytochrome c-type biogenesis protein CcmH
VILFWIICVGLLAFALLYVLPPALRSDASTAKHEDARRETNIAIYRDQLVELETDLGNGIVGEEQYAQDRDDIERRLLEDIATDKTPKKSARVSADTRKHAYMIGVGLALVAVIFYLRVGNPDAITNAATSGGAATQTAPSEPTGERSQAQIEANVAALAKRLQSNPSDAQGWTMLARSYGSLEKYPEAVGAYAKATELSPNDADLWADYAYASAMANGRTLEGQPMEFIERALKLDPDNAKALGLAANAAFEANQYQKAIDYWERLRKRVPSGSDVAQAIDSRISEARSRLSSGAPQK